MLLGLLFNTYFSQMISPKSHALLIADPFLKEDPFKRSVVYLCTHDNTGSIGFIINKPSGFYLYELINGVSSTDIEVFTGGPVGEDTLHFIHQEPQLIPGGQQIGKSTYWGGDFEKAIDAIKKGTINTDAIKFFLGYSGWSSGQLAGEIKENNWLLAPASQPIIFNTSAEQCWEQSILSLGKDYQELIYYPIDPQLN